MSYPPAQAIALRDGGVGLINNATALPLVVGVTGKVTGTDTLYQYTDPNLCRDEQLSGPALELALPMINFAGGVMLLKTGATTAGANSTVTATRVSTSTGTITIAGTPTENRRVINEITATGGLGAGRFKYSLDGGYNYSEEYTIPSGGTFIVPGTGITQTFVPGAGPVMFEKGDKHNYTSAAAHYTTANLGTAMTALLAQIGSRKIRKVFFAGKNATATAAATMAAAVSTHLTTLEAANYYARALIDAGEDTAANVKTQFTSFADDRVGVVYGNADIIGLNSMAGWGVPRFPALNAIAERAAIAQLSENLGRKFSGVLRGVRAITHDEGTNTQFSALDKINTLRTFRGQPGFYVTNGFLKAPTGSDFLYWDWGTTIDEICETVFEAQDKWLLAKLRTLTDGTGRIDKRDAERVASSVRSALKSRLLDPINIEGFLGHVSGLSYTVDQSNDFLATRTLRSTCSAIPLPPIEGIETTIGFARSLT